MWIVTTIDVLLVSTAVPGVISTSAPADRILPRAHSWKTVCVSWLDTIAVCVTVIVTA